MRNFLRRIAFISCGLFALLMLQPVNTPIAYGDDDCCWDSCGCDCCCDNNDDCDKPGCSKCSQGSQQVELPRYNGPAWTAEMDALLAQSATTKDTIQQLRDADGDGVTDHVVYVKLDDDGNIEYVVSYPTADENAEPDTYAFCAPPPPGGGECPTHIGQIDPFSSHFHPNGKRYWCTHPTTAIGGQNACVEDVGNDGDPGNDGDGHLHVCVPPGATACPNCQ